MGNFHGLFEYEGKVVSGCEAEFSGVRWQSPRLESAFGLRDRVSLRYRSMSLQTRDGLVMDLAFAPKHGAVLPRIEGDLRPFSAMFSHHEAKAVCRRVEFRRVLLSRSFRSAFGFEGWGRDQALVTFDDKEIALRIDGREIPLECRAGSLASPLRDVEFRLRYDRPRPAQPSNAIGIPFSYISSTLLHPGTVAFRHVRLDAPVFPYRAGSLFDGAILRMDRAILQLVTLADGSDPGVVVEHDLASRESTAIPPHPAFFPGDLAAV